MKVKLKPGTRLRSVVCETEVMVVKASGQEVALCCGGHPMVEPGQEGKAELSEDYSQGTLMGKRYVDEGETLEFLCVKAGAGALSIDGIVLKTREARALPSSD